MEKEDLTELCSILLAKTTAISFLSCMIDFKRIKITESLEMIRSIQIKGDSEILSMSTLLDQCPNLKRFEYCGIYIFDQLTKLQFVDRHSALQRVIISTYFFSPDSLEAFLN
jgi:hypothetical protein